ncbi:MAG: carbohydrate ABC transporter permease [Planctomycetes bacterium]|nr:carbohydrate ABC transporter permease [Planctomycetota bacterium]
MDRNDRSTTGNGPTDPLRAGPCGRALRRACPGLLLAFLVLLALTMLFPFLWMAVNSFKTEEDFHTRPFALWPETWTLSTYEQAVTIGRVGIYLWNSFAYAVTVTLAQLFVDSLAAYAFARMSFRGRDALFGLVLATMLLPASVQLIPLFLIVKWMGLVNTFAGVVLPSFAGAFGIFMLRQFFLNLPRDLEDAARIDGCGPFGIYWRVALPMARPALVTLGLFLFLSEWGSFIWPLVILSDTSRYPVTVGIALFRNESFIYWNNVFAASVLASLPLIGLFFVAQKHLMGGISLSGLKG